MKVLYYESEITEIVENITDYIQQTDSAEEREQYTEELAQVKDNFLNLVESGVFHDAMGKTINVFENFGQLVAEVETEY